MLDIVRSSERFHLQNDWLSAYWHFSFDHYHDPSNMNWGPLRVFNNDTIQPSRGFPMHPHRDMEILTYVISGALEQLEDALTAENNFRRKCQTESPEFFANLPALKFEKHILLCKNASCKEYDFIHKWRADVTARGILEVGA